MNTIKKTWVSDLLFLTIIIAIFFGAFLGRQPLRVPDEGRYAEIPREMLATHDFITPRLNYVQYFEKPPLYYWMQAASLKMFGLNEWAVRFCSAFFGLLGCLMTYVLARILYDRRTGWLSSGVLATSLLYFSMAHLATTDMVLTFFLTASLSMFMIALHQPFPSRARRLCFYGFYAAAACALLTKGLIAIVFPGLIIGSWMLLCHEWRVLRTMYLFSGTLLFLLVALPWHIAVQILHPAFFHFYVIEQHFLRYATIYAHHTEPVWFFFLILLAGFFPWILFLPQTFIAHWRKRYVNKDGIFLILWAGLILFFFSFSQSKLIPYILPIFPPLAILVGHFLIERSRTSHFYTMTTKVLLAIAAIFSLAFIIIAPKIEPRFAHSVKPLTQILKPMLRATDEVACFNDYDQDLPFYLERRIMIVDWMNELSFGMSQENTTQWMVSRGAFWHHWNSAQRVFVFVEKEPFDESFKQAHRKFYLLGETSNDVLLVNHI